jgi:hypothetical protein
VWRNWIPAFGNDVGGEARLCQIYFVIPEGENPVSLFGMARVMDSGEGRNP